MMDFREDIQTLRGISVLFVVLFHLGFSPLVGGFLGVDVFFVISGFLMAILYNFENKIDFFKRRARRLLPPYFFVIIATVFATFILTTPNETEQVVKQSIFGSVFMSNVGFWLQNSYFSKSEFNPLLHLWSLGVEIQFYLIVPVLSWFFRRSKIFLPIILVVSMFLCFIVLTKSPKTSFFILPFRLWEFLVGFGTAQIFTKKGQVKFKGYEWIGLIAMLSLLSIPFMPVDGQSLSVMWGHPGLLSLLICLATSGVLIFGVPSFIQQSFVGKSLVWFGKYSYSIYLVHFPIIVLFLFEPFGGTIIKPSSYIDTFSILALIVIGTYFLFNYVERMKITKVFTLVAAGTAMSITAPILLTYIQNNVISESERKIFGAFTDRGVYRCGKLFRVINPLEISCELNNIEAPSSTVMLIGNSHSDSIKTSVSRVLTENNERLLFLVPNNPLMQGGTSVSRVFEDVVYHDVDKLLIHYSTGGFPTENVMELTNLAIEKGIEVYVIEPIPFWEVHIPQHMYSHKDKAEDFLDKDLNSYLKDNDEVFKSLDLITSKLFHRLSVSDIFCNDSCVFKNHDEVPLYFDSNHLTLTGAELLEDKLRDSFINQ